MGSVINYVTLEVEERIEIGTLIKAPHIPLPEEGNKKICKFSLKF